MGGRRDARRNLSLKEGDPGKGEPDVRSQTGKME
jgi:hypothetical protein